MFTHASTPLELLTTLRIHKGLSYPGGNDAGDCTMVHEMATRRGTSRSERKVGAEPIFRPSPERWPGGGVYQLWIRVPTDRWIRVGLLGRFRFPAGTYVYTGRATRGLRARVRRHADGARTKHWHIDYLLESPGVVIERIVLAATVPSYECAVHRSIADGAACPAPGFGSSDCREGCPAHLWWFPVRHPQRKSGLTCPVRVSRRA